MRWMPMSALPKLHRGIGCNDGDQGLVESSCCARNRFRQHEGRVWALQVAVAAARWRQLCGTKQPSLPGMFVWEQECLRFGQER